MKVIIPPLFTLFTVTATTAMLAGPLSAVHASEQKPGTIAVSATGSATVAPDMAILNLTVQREGETAREALSANNTAMADVLKAMRDAGIEDRDIQTSNFNIQPRYVYPKPQKKGQPLPPRIVGYIVYNSLTVRVRDLKILGNILDQSVSLGVNSGGNISFTTDKPGPVIEIARKNALLC